MLDAGMRTSALLTCGLLALGVTVASQVQTPTPTNAAPPALNGSISGVVMDGSTDAPLAEAVVTVSPLLDTTLPVGYPARQMTDARGRFVFMRLPSDGVFQITASKFGYLDGGYGRDSAPTDSLRPIVISNGSWTGNLRVNIWTAATISGIVRDEGGEPLVGVFVRALARIRVAGRADFAAGPLTMTDDHGRYRISGLLPGRYVIQVPSLQMSAPAGTRVGTSTDNTPAGAVDVDETSRLMIGGYPLPPPSQNGRPMAYGVSFHPNVSTPADAATIEVGFGDDRPGIDVSLTPVPAVRVSGTVEGPPAELAALTLRLLPLGMENLGLGGEVATTLVAANGTFTFLTVPARSYVLDAPTSFSQFTIASGTTMTGGFVGTRGTSLPQPPSQQGGWNSSSQATMSNPGVNLSTSNYRGGVVQGSVAPTYTGRTNVTVGGADVTGVVVRMRPGAVLRGRVTVDPDATKPAQGTTPRFFFFMDPASGQPGLGQPRAATSITPETAAFEIPGLQPAEYFLRLQGFEGWMIKSIQWRGQDYTTLPLDAASADDLSGVAVTVTNAIPVITGTVRDRDGTTPESGLVVLFPVQPALRTNTGLWSPRLTSTPMRSNGTFRVTGLPAGDYFIAAIDRPRMRTWRDPEFLAQVERTATRVTLAWGQTLTQNLTVGR